MARNLISSRDQYIKHALSLSAAMGMVVGMALAVTSGEVFVILLIFIFASCIITFYYPEIAFLLFLNAGAYKKDPRLEAIVSVINIDLTVYFEAVCFLGIIIGALRGRIKLARPLNKMLIPYLTVIGVSFLSSIYTMAPIYGEEKFLRLLVVTSFALWGPWFLFQNLQRLRRFMIAWVVLASAMVLDFLGGGLQPEEFVFASAFSSSGYLGFGAITAQSILILLFGIFPTMLRNWHKVWILPILVLNIFGILVSGARTSTIVILVIIAFMLAYRIVSVAMRLWQWGLARRKDIQIIKVLALVMLIIVIIFVCGHKYFVTIEKRAILLFREPGEFAAERIFAASAAADAIIRFPFGLGIGGFSMYFYHFDGKRGGFPHNLILEVGSELGWPGLIGFVLLCYWCVMPYKRSMKKVPHQYHFMGVTLIVLFTFGFLYFQFHGDLNDARTLFNWIGCLFAYWKASLSLPQFRPSTPTPIAKNK